MESRIREILFPKIQLEPPEDVAQNSIWRNNLCDVLVAWSHAFHKWDYLVTGDKNFHNHKSELKKLVVQIRRALEAVANEHKAPAGTLYKQVEGLIKNNLLPDTFGKMIQITRMIGNLGAHDAEKDVQLEDTEIVGEFFRAAIEYIYIAPAKVERVASLLKGESGE